MKKTRLYLMITMLSLGAFTTISASEINPKTTAPPIEIQVMLDRLEEIKGMDKSELNRANKKELRKEVRAIKSEISSSGNGIYISGSAIIIILLLILIF